MPFKDLFLRKKLPEQVYSYDYYAGMQPPEDDVQPTFDSVSGNTDFNPNPKPVLEKKAPPLIDVDSQGAALKHRPEPISIEPVDGDFEAFTNWSVEPKIGDKQDVVPKAPTVGKMPELKRPNVAPYAPTSARSFGQPVKSEPLTSARPWPTYRRELPLKDVIAFIIENSNDVLKYKNDILNILSNNVKNKKDAIFVFIRVGNGKKSYVPMDFDDLTKQNILASLLDDSLPTEQVNLASALYYVRNVSKVFNQKEFTFKKSKYKLNSCSIICIGGSSFIDSDYVKKAIATCIQDLKDMPKLKAFKYFCIKDCDAVKVASLGFPVIGHIVSNFYG